MLMERNLIDTEEGLSKGQLIEEFLTLFIAGTDTTSHLMGMLLYYLSTNPDVQARLRDEVLSLKR
jgi:cytochrome P450